MFMARRRRRKFKAEAVVLVALLLVASPRTALADASAGWIQDPDAVRISASVGVGAAGLYRSSTAPTSVSAFALSGDVHVYPYSANGFYFGYDPTVGVPFGPTANIFTAGYSLRIGNRRLKDTIATATLDFGPAYGSVEGDGANHGVLGGHAGITLDVRFLFATIGLAGGYQGGLPLSGVPERWEGAWIATARVGVVFDVARRRPYGSDGEREAATPRADR
jgi:hypothetical protein